MPELARFYLLQLLRSAHFQRGIFILFLLDKGLSGAEIGALQAILYAVNFVAEVPTGMLGDRFGRRASVLFGLVLAALNGVAQLVFGGFAIFALLFAVQGVALAFLSGSDAALFYDFLKANGREADYVKHSGRLQLVSGVSLAVAMVAGGFMRAASWSWVYGAYAAAMALGAVCAATLHEQRVSAPEPVVTATRAFFTDASGRRLLPLVIGSGFLHAALTPYFVLAQPLLADGGLSFAAIGAVYAGVQVLAGLVATTAERFAQRSLAAMFAGTVALVIACLLANLIGVMAISITAFVIAMTVPEILIVIVDGHLQEHIPSSVRASVLSGFSLLEACFISLGYVGSGVAADRFGIALAIASLSVFAALALVIARTYFTRRVPAPS